MKRDESRLQRNARLALIRTRTTLHRHYHSDEDKMNDAMAREHQKRLMREHPHSDEDWDETGGFRWEQ